MLIVVSALPKPYAKPVSDHNQSVHINQDEFTRHNYRVVLACELDCLNTRIMSTPAPDCSTLLDIPQKNLAVSTNAGEPGVVCCDGNVQHRVPVRFILLDRGRRLCGGSIVIVGNSPGEVNSAICRAGEDIGSRIAGEGHCVHGA